MVDLYASTLSLNENVRALIRNIYGYYVVERVLMRCTNDTLKQQLRDEVLQNLPYLGNKNLKHKWIDLIEKSKMGELRHVEHKIVQEQRQKDCGHYHE